MKKEKRWYIVPWEEMIDWDKIPKEKRPKNVGENTDD